MVLDRAAGYAEQPGNKMLNFPVVPGERIFDGAIVQLEGTGVNTGRVQNWTDKTGTNDRLAGIARIKDQSNLDTRDGESVVGNTARSVRINVDVSGPILRSVTVTGSTVVFSTGSVVFSEDENSFQVAPTGGGKALGWIVEARANEECDIQIFPAGAWRVADFL